VTNAVNITNQLSNAIQQVSSNAETGASTSEKATQVARGGAQTVNDTISGMKTIKDKVDLSARKVQEMGDRSKQIGLIVETIEDIASQTNMLALNAAIEAARAGEHGKGFAVVADEVRKLAEKSASATKEIAALVKGIQSTVNEAVTAMQEGAVEVEHGVGQANQAGQALSQVLTASAEVNQKVAEIAAAAKQMNNLSNELVKATDVVSVVVDDNTDATRSMQASSDEVSHAMESIASVSEENTAAVEEVNASAEDMSAQVAMVAESADSLAKMADSMAKIVAQFRLNAGTEAPKSQR
jgi:methyl-accepting chemotaxis protein